MCKNTCEVQLCLCQDQSGMAIIRRDCREIVGKFTRRRWWKCFDAICHEPNELMHRCYVQLQLIHKHNLALNCIHYSLPLFRNWWRIRSLKVFAWCETSRNFIFIESWQMQSSLSTASLDESKVSTNSHLIRLFDDSRRLNLLRMIIYITGQLCNRRRCSCYGCGTM